MIYSGTGNQKNKLLSKCFSSILIIAACIFFANSQGMADLIFKSADKLKTSKIKKFKAPIITVSVPVQIMDLPEPWRDADLVVMAEAVFYSKGNDSGPGYGYEGLTFGRTIKSQPLKNGSSQGMVHVLLYELHGVITGQYYTFSMVLAKLGDKCKILGFGWNAPGDSGGLTTEIKENMENLIDTVIPWNATITPF